MSIKQTSFEHPLGPENPYEPKEVVRRNDDGSVRLFTVMQINPDEIRGFVRLKEISARLGMFVDMVAHQNHHHGEISKMLITDVGVDEQRTVYDGGDAVYDMRQLPDDSWHVNKVYDLYDHRNNDRIFASNQNPTMVVTCVMTLYPGRNVPMDTAPNGEIDALQREVNNFEIAIGLYKQSHDNVARDITPNTTRPRVFSAFMSRFTQKPKE